MNKLRESHKQVIKVINKLLLKLLMSQVPTVVIIRLKTGETTIPGVVWCRVYGVGWFPTVVIIRLSQPPAGDWLAGFG